MALSVVGALLFGLNHQVARAALNDADAAAKNLAAISDAVTVSQSLDEVHDELLGTVRLAYLDLAEQGTEADLSQFGNDIDALGERSRALRVELSTLSLPTDLAEEAIALMVSSEQDVTDAHRAIDQVMASSGGDRQNLLRFETASASREQDINAALAAMIARRARARAFAAEQTDRERQTLLLGSAIGAMALLALGFGVQLTLTRSIRRLGSTAEAMAGGDLAVRAVEQGPGEVRELARSFNSLANSLATMIQGYESEAARDAFDSRLGEALEMAETEHETFAVLAEAMVEVVPELPSELLMTDGTRALLDRVAEHGNAGPAGCEVDSPSACVAVRRGVVATFESSRALNACPHLRDRSGGACSAVCAPITFMGQALGVLHVRSPEHRIPDATQLAGLQTMATLTGARVGTLRALAQTNKMAMTDPLTGLSNRRDAQPRLMRMVERHDQASLVMVDLDRFKLLNDTFGHDAGDRALRAFARTLNQSVREVDVVARWGGEEFVLGLPGLDAEGAIAVVERVQLSLDVAAMTSGAPSFTASFGIVDLSRSRFFDELIRLADQALYEAKKAGRNCYRVASISSADDTNSESVGATDRRS
ncbi:MAG: diguanylate cyclase [Acidimicrobiales bacterium]